jgi:hypothetical protein
MPTVQETFDTVITAIVKQGKPSMIIDDSNNMACRYRGPDGLKCAAGHLIPDDEYSLKMEGCSVSSTVTAKILTKNGHNIPVVSELQRCHDDNADNEDFVSVFLRDCREVAERFTLEWKYGAEANAD